MTKQRLLFTLNKMAATRFTPDAVNSQKLRSGMGGLSQRHTTEPPQHHNNRRYDSKHTKGSATNGCAVLARLVPNYCHYTLFLYLCVCLCMFTQNGF